MRSDRCARFSNRATFQTQAPLPASVPNPLLCLSSSEAVDTSAEARQNLPAICRHRQKHASGSTCQSRKCQRESECSLQRVEKAVLGTRDFRLQRFWMRSLGALLSGRSGCPRLASQPSQFQCFIAGMKRLLILQLFGALVVTMADATTNFDLAA